MVISTRSFWEPLVELFERRYDEAIIHGDADGETVLHSGPVRIRANGWVELPSGRLLSPEAVHHIDTQTDG